MRLDTTSTTSTQAVPNVMSRGKWAKRILEAWQKQLPSIFEVGSLLESAKDELRKADWRALIKNDLPFGKRTADRLIAIATDDRLRTETHASHLPACWMTLYELDRLTDEQIEDGIRTGAINRKVQRKDVKALCGTMQKSGEPRVSPMALLKRQLDERIHEIAHLKEQLAYADQGSLFDLKKDTPKNIAEVVVSTVTESKWNAIDAAARAAFKAKKKVGGAS